VGVGWGCGSRVQRARAGSSAGGCARGAQCGSSNGSGCQVGGLCARVRTFILSVHGGGAVGVRGGACGPVQHRWQVAMRSAL